MRRNASEQVGNGEVTSRHHRDGRLLVTTFRGHLSAKLAEEALKQVEHEVPADMPEGLRPSVWVVNALEVTGFDGQAIRKPVGRLLTLIRERIAPHTVLLRVEDESVMKQLGKAAVILFARGITFGNGVKLHLLQTMDQVQPHVENLRKEGILK
jgi:hypothetical protein